LGQKLPRVPQVFSLCSVRGRSILGTEVLMFKKLLATVDDSTLTFSA